MVTDQHSAYAALLTPFILKLKEKESAMTPAEKTSLHLLSDWDYDMNANLVAPTIFEFFRKSFSHNLLGDELGDLYNSLPGGMNDYYIYRILKTGADEWVDDINTPQKETLDDIIQKSFSDCIKVISQSYGSDVSKWTWGSIHTITLEHPMGSVKILDKIFGLNSAVYPIGGSNHTVCPYTYDEGFKVTDGASERHIFNTANWDESYTVIPTGASGVPSSEFYLSQTKTYLDGKFYKDAFSENAVKASAIYTLVFKPVK
jgi:penicillin amidase